MMIITLELQTDDAPRQTLLTLGMFCPDGSPELVSVLTCCAEKWAVTPPDEWERTFRGQRWRVRRIPAPTFMVFLRRWRHIPEVNAFLDRHLRLVRTSLNDIPGVSCHVWVHEAAAVVVLPQLPRRRRRDRIPDVCVEKDAGRP
ncbi:hypothetical protein EL06_20915 [Salmonella enterica subsp. diarizonae]|uniref:Uncharacterized protein n=1 Tax=Salmonella diarizonae TaxID=59204 RepID=A0A6C8Y0S9_SALDZ|nr:hypothetical protein [Salmonella enterica subsp. diarizonae]